MRGSCYRTSRNDLFDSFGAEKLRMLIYAHRGTSALHPENTQRAFQRALALESMGSSSMSTLRPMGSR
jgi:glycerophosphoryl diester phosphodiesterase